MQESIKKNIGKKVKVELMMKESGRVIEYEGILKEFNEDHMQIEFTSNYHVNLNAFVVTQIEELE